MEPTSPRLLGDMTEEAFKKLGIDRLAKAYERVTGKPCGCQRRKEKLNNLHRVALGLPTHPVDELPK